MSKIVSLERIEWEGETFAIILRKEWQTENVAFFTDRDSFLQLGVLAHKKVKR